MLIFIEIAKMELIFALLSRFVWAFDATFVLVYLKNLWKFRLCEMFNYNSIFLHQNEQEIEQNILKNLKQSKF